jgi:uncharacterized protein with PIN domain
MLGKLAKLLRAAGYDTYYQKDIQDHRLLRLALEEERVIVTKDRKLVEVKSVPSYILVGADKPLEQLEELRQKAGLHLEKRNVFSRCIECNAVLVSIEKDKVKEKVYPYVYQTQEKFWHCPGCDRIYWAGTHIQKMKEKFRNAGLIQGE